EGEAINDGARPVPVRVKICGLPGASSTTVTLPVRLPPAVGVNVIVIVQLAPTASEAPQLFVCAKSPVAMMLVIFNGALPVFVIVTLWGPLVVLINWGTGKFNTDPPEKVTLGAIPVPVRGTICGLPVASSENVRVPVRAPIA